ncbi:MAG: hypothetical protein JNL80_07970 [Phycisphaerae bacterium]|jgi:hypothetical protein|nr:hypothetical protein [Phycisphaerae bacterium]
MARKPSQPALYELIRHKPRGPIVPVSSARGPAISGPLGHSGGGGVPIPPSIAPSPAASSQPIGPGRFIKVPVGYAYVAIGVALAALVGVYMYGFSAGESAASKRFEERRIEELNAHGSLPAVDPMKAGQTPPSLVDGGVNGGQDGAPQGDGNGGTGRNAGGSGDQDPSGTDLGPPPGTDPRQPGLNYFILAGRLGTLEGDPMVRFCRKNGLDAHLVPDDNAKLRLLIVCPGFSARERQSPAVKALEAKIRAVGRKYESTGPGRRDFADLYPKLHKVGQ